MPKNVLVPLDQSSLSEKALSYAADILDNEGKLTLLSIIEIPTTYYNPSAAIAGMGLDYTMDELDQMRERAITEAKSYLAEHAAQLRRTYHIQVDTEVMAGTPADCILELANDADVDAIAMSTHGRSGLSRWVFGSVTQKVLQGAQTPIYVIPNVPTD